MKNSYFYKYLTILFISILLLSIPTSVFCDDEPREAKEKEIYLTFDDGPSGKVTTEVLDILKAEGVPATFFIIGNQIDDQEDLILRMRDEGHSIGLHSYTHERNNLYSSNDGFINEMLKVQKRLYDVTGETYTILRFPFGSTNNTYKLTSSMVDLVHNHGFKIYDWTQDTLDGANPKSSPDSIYSHAISDKDSIILLMHCANVNKTSPQALPQIIKYYKDKGYTFKKITEETPELYRLKK
ncbi:polysaccharide deacetylase [Clostridium sp. NSJ-145]|uniref:polysaccharide deacetylase family protein n=1 Tax=Clostridium sp. NSJ-145 TaxID=2897777 RepID=UPI001E49635E|nr:polysaccharide deacetylase family protein [Clostridium sp. NSJ-145]MCD2501961.1 polysaccharide deacetylase [Clostridium sp. NSJ-145]